MSYLDLLATQALLGTSRDVGDLPPPPAPLADVLNLPSASAESAILRAAGVYCLYERAGRLATKKDATRSLLSPDGRPLCSKRAATILKRLLSHTDTSVLIEWLTACVRSAQRPPAGVIPALLDAATRRIEHRSLLRAPTAAAVGPLGLSLCRLNPDWSSLVAEDASTDAQEIWQTGNKQERLAALRRLRATDPATARDLLTSTASAESAADRAAFLETLSIGLSSADESFLEASLADRSKEVRANAGALLVRLPGSAFVARMIARLTPLLTFTPAESAKLLKKAKPAKLEIELPAEFDESMKRDGLESKPGLGAGFGERQFWLLQMLSLVSPSRWSKTFSTPPARLIEAIPKDYSDLIKMAWHNAALNTSDSDWAEAFIRLGNAGKQQRVDENLLKLLPDARRHAVIYDLLSVEGLASELIYSLVSSGPLNARSTRVLIELIADRAGGLTTNYDHQLAQLLPRVALVAPPELLPAFELAWPLEKFSAAKGAHESFFLTLSLRRDIQKEFA